MSADPPESIPAMFQRKIKVAPELAERLAAGGLTSIEEVAYYPWGEFLEISRLSHKDAEDVRYIAKTYLLNEALGDDDEDF